MAQSNLAAMNKYPSLSSIHSMISVGYLPPGHGYIPKKVKPDKPYGPSYVTILNRTWRGPGRRCLRYALVACCLAILFYVSTALYFAHRNVQRLIVKNTEPLGALLLMAAILMTSAMFYFIHRARLESNRWRSFLRFRPDGLFHVVPINEEYSPRYPFHLATGTYGPRAVKEIPKPRYMRKSRPGSRAGGRQRGTSMMPVAEGDEEPLVRNENTSSQERLDAPQRFKAEMPLVHKPQPVRPGPPGSPNPLGPPGLSGSSGSPGPHRGPPGPPQLSPSSMCLPPSSSQMEKFPSRERLPTWQMSTSPEQRYAEGFNSFQEPRSAPDYRMATKSEVAPPGVPQMERIPQMTEPRPPPGGERTMAATRSTPQPRMVPGTGRLPPTERPPAGAGRPQPVQPRMPAGRQQPKQERMVPGQSKQPTVARMIPGSRVQAP